MNFISNHDENSWSGTEQERMGDAIPLFAALCYVVPGMPMIYTGQLSGNHHRLEFFEKDLIDVEPEFAQAELYKGLNDLRAAHPALFSPEKGAPMVRVPADNPFIFACSRTLDDDRVVAVMNMSGEEQTVTIQLEDEQTLTLQPWEYIIF